MKNFKLLGIILLGFLICNTLTAEKLTTISDVLKPTWLAVDDNQFYITEGAQVYIYSLETFQLIKKFGKEGNGPKEFATAGGQLPLILFPLKDKLQVNSLNRISFFSKDGNYLDMIKSKGGIAFIFRPILPDKFIARGVKQEDGIGYSTIDLYDSKLTKIKELIKVKRAAQRTGPIKLFSDRVTYETFEDKIFLQSHKDFIITVLDNQGETLYEIKKEDYERVKFTKKSEDDLWETLEKDPRQRAAIPILKQRAQFPKYWSAIASIMVADNFLYTITWKYDKDKFECYIFDAKNGKELKKSFIPFQRPSPLSAYPAAVKKGILYQLVETDDEEWALTAVKLN